MLKNMLDWDSLLTVDLISEKLECCYKNDDPNSIKEEMEKQNWDVMGFIHKASQNGSPAYYICREHLENSDSGFRPLPLEINDLVSSYSPLAESLSKLLCRKRLFVMGSKGVDRIVTTADLQKQPVRMMLFSAISSLEMVMLSVIRSRFRDDGWKTHLSEKRLKKAESLHESLRKQNQEKDLVECLEFCDKRDVFLREGLSKSYGFSQGRFRELLENLEKIRNNLAHAGRADSDQDWQIVLAAFEGAKGLTQKIVEHENLA